MASWRTRKKIGIVLFACGTILIVLGLIVGLLIPSKIRTGLTERACIDSKDHSEYKNWVGPSVSENLIYHWHIANKDEFLYKGAAPKFEEKGPYVYTEESKKINVEFDEQKPLVSYKSFKKQKFDAKRTKQLCKQCEENDKLSVLNSAYLGFIAQAGDADNFGKAFAPLMVSLLLSELSKGSKDENTTFELLAKNVSKMSALPNSEKFNPMFGSWVHSAGHHSAFNNASFTPDEMRALYGILKNDTRLGPPRNTIVLNNCKTGNPCHPACGFMMCLGVYAKTYFNVHKNQTAVMKNVLSGYLCPANSSSCFKFTKSEHLLILSSFVLNVLPAYVHWSMENSNYGLVTTRNQSELALGYLIKLPMPGHPEGYFVQGGLPNHINETIASKKATESTFYTCKSGDAKKYQWAKYNSSAEVDQRFFPNASLEQKKIRGYLRQFPGAAQLKACSEDYEPREKSYEMFLSNMHVRVNIIYKKAVQVEGLKMHRYELDKSAMEKENVFVFKKGLIDVSNVYSFPSYMGFPRFLEGDPELWKRLNLSEADIEKHGTFVDIEPVSGTVMNAKFRVQFNVGLNKNTVPSNKSSFSEFKIKDLQEKDPIVFPVFWVEAGGAIGANDASDFKSQVFGLLRIACAILVSFTLIGAICFIIGLVLMALACKKSGTLVSDVSAD